MSLLSTTKRAKAEVLLVFLCVSTCTQNGFVAGCVIEGMPHLSSACMGFPGCPFDV